jgi:hypothetical protein
MSSSMVQQTWIYVPYSWIPCLLDLGIIGLQIEIKRIIFLLKIFINFRRCLQLNN